MIDKNKIHEVLHSLWDNNGNTEYNRALQDAQTAFDLMQEEPEQNPVILYGLSGSVGKLKELVDNVSEEGLVEARKQLQELVNGGLDEEINRYIEQHNGEFSGYFFNLRRIAWHFANWRQQEMMKESTDAKIGFWDGELVFDYDQNQMHDYLKSKGLTGGDKVKIYLIKVE